jgi:hypothetical protein
MRGLWLSPEMPIAGLHGPQDRREGESVASTTRYRLNKMPYKGDCGAGLKVKEVNDEH